MGTILSKIGIHLLNLMSHQNKAIYLPEYDSDSDSSIDTDGNREEFQDSTSEDDHYVNYATRSGENSLSFDAASSTDAVNYFQSGTTKESSRNIDVGMIDNQLEYYEKVSLVFLLYEDASQAIHDIETPHFPKKILTKWSEDQQRGNNTKWRDQLIESLCLIKNFAILKSYGYNKNDLSARFLPNSLMISVNITKYKKFMYFLCENLNRFQVETLVNAVRSDLVKNRLPIRHFEYLYLELYLLHWEQCNYIGPNNLDNFYKKLKQLDFLDLCDLLKDTLMPKLVEEKPKTDKSLTQAKKKKDTFDKILDDDTGLCDLLSLGNSNDNSVGASSVLNSMVSMDEDEFCHQKYSIDLDNPGVCLIINQENFYRDVNPKHKRLLPQNHKPLETRQGTAKDRDDLENVFKNFGYRTIVFNDLVHEELVEKVRIVSESIRKESSLFVCILSHGDQGVVYGVNSCAVSVTKVQNIICNGKNLAGKPKILILQSCQGDRCQPIVHCVDDDLETDGPTQSLPVMLDLFTFWATVPGYGAIRHKNDGSWFIQSMCDKLPKLSTRCDFDDICTRIIHDVSSKKWMQKTGEVAMVPLKSSTFSKKFFLPPYKKTVF